MKTNAARILDRLKIRYDILEYEVDPNNLDAEHIAGQLGLEAERVFKTLLVRGDRQGVCFAVIPANTQLDLKQLARLSGDRKMNIVPLKDVQSLTGYIRGGVTVLGSKKALSAYVHSSIQELETIAVSAGMRGKMVLIAAQDYLNAVSGTVGAIAKPTSGSSTS